ncbi:MAG: hypothetical protein ABSE63_01560 [Thermoguttaceae bacterium]|jgi:hypothetical protein
MEPLPNKNHIEQVADQNQSRYQSGKTGVLINVIAFLVCLIVGVALIHANLLVREKVGYYPIIDIWLSTVASKDGRQLYPVGWPAFYGIHRDTHSLLDFYSINFRWLLIDIIMGLLLLTAILIRTRSWLSVLFRKRQFSIADIFLLITAFAFVLSLLSLEKRCKLSFSTLDNHIYSTLSAYPWYDLIPISYGILCCVCVVLMALVQLLKSSSNIEDEH